jgi:hypothetical protein
MSDTAKPKRKSKGKQHPVHSESLFNIAHDIKNLTSRDFSPDALATIFTKEGLRVQKIIR